MLRGPTDQQRTIVLGRTGSGKSQFATGLQSTRNFDEMPWIWLDYKREDLIDDIVTACRGAIPDIKPTDKVPTKPGMYRMLLSPVLDDDAIIDFLWRVYKQGNVGLNLDEGFALPQKHGQPFDVILTQGRSLHIPVIALYQRPVYMSRFAVAQADYFAVFEQNDIRDLKTTSQFVKPAKDNAGNAVSVFSPLPKYSCLWHDVGQGETTVLAPAPDRQLIINTFINRLKPVNRKALI
jgi:hypothetical protein